MAAKWKVYIHMTNQSQQLINRLHFLKSGALATPEAVAIEIRDNWLNYIRPLQHSDLAYLRISVYDMDFQGAAVYDLGTPGINGTGAGSITAPLFAALLVKWVTGLTGPSRRGRIYIPGLRGPLTSSDGLFASAVAPVATQMNLIKARYMTGGSGPLRLIVTKDGYSDAPMYEVTNYVTRNQFGVQRRRKLGVGA
jgi:hypothetical protein